MKTAFKFLAIAGLSILAGACTQEEDTSIPDITPVIAFEDFLHSADNTILTIEGWQNVATAGNVLWKQQIFQGNGYAEFSPFQSTDASTIGWLISPEVDLDLQEGEILRFQSSQSFVSSAQNKLEVFYSTNYDGTNIAAATWTPIVANLPTPDATFFEFQDSGEISLNEITGKIRIAFRYTGSGTNSSLDGSYQIDSFRIYYNK
jgi:hypothetical protein